MTHLVYSSSVFQQAISAVSIDSESCLLTSFPFSDGVLTEDVDARQ